MRSSAPAAVGPYALLDDRDVGRGTGPKAQATSQRSDAHSCMYYDAQVHWGFFYDVTPAASATRSQPTVSRANAHVRMCACAHVRMLNGSHVLNCTCVHVYMCLSSRPRVRALVAGRG